MRPLRVNGRDRHDYVPGARYEFATPHTLPMDDASYREHLGQPLTVVRKNPPHPQGWDEGIPTWEVRAADGWSGDVFEGELVPWVRR